MEKIFLLEIRRQVAHLLFGILLALLLFLGWIDAFLLGLLTLLSALLMFYWKWQRGGNSFWQKILFFLERKENMESLPGKGLFFFLLGVFVVTAIFPKEIALSSILILAVADSICHIYGRFFGKIKTPLHPKKNIEGHIMGAIAAGFTAGIFVPFAPALMAAAVGMFVEIFCGKKGKIQIDDNLLIPLSAGILLWSWNSLSPFLQT